MVDVVHSMFSRGRNEFAPLPPQLFGRVFLDIEALLPRLAPTDRGNFFTLRYLVTSVSFGSPLEVVIQAGSAGAVGYFTLRFLLILRDWKAARAKGLAEARTKEAQTLLYEELVEHLVRQLRSDITVSNSLIRKVLDPDSIRALREMPRAEGIDIEPLP
jgi:hypothetical protein